MPQEICDLYENNAQILHIRREILAKTHAVFAPTMALLFSIKLDKGKVMKRIGLIGGMSWESTATYYRMINEAVRDSRGGLVSADIVMHSLDFSEVVALQKADRWDEAGALLGAAGARLANAGADCVLICTNTMHLVADTVEKMSGVALIDIIDETAAALKADGRRKPLLLATRYTMEHGFYTDRMRRHGVDVAR